MQVYCVETRFKKKPMSKLLYMMSNFWDPYVWLPPNITWSDLAPNEELSRQYTNHRDLSFPLLFAVLFLSLRYCLEKYWFAPVGMSLGIKNTKSKKPIPNPILEKAFLMNTKLKHKQILALTKEVLLNERQVERWLRLRRMQDKPSTLTKFCETSWRWLYYTLSFSYGVMIMWEKPWLWDVNYCYFDYPYHGVTSDVWWYYMVSMSFYWSLLVSQFFDVRRKDFWQMFIHHVATLCLLSFSWVCNLHRLGTLILLIHDCADAFLEAAKLAKYTQFQRLCEVLFAVFTVVWILTRCCIYPFWILHSTIFEAPKIIPMFPAYYIFNSLLILLLVLHIFWTHVIVKIALKSVSSGQMGGDIRSSSSEQANTSTYSNTPPKHSPKKHK